MKASYCSALLGAALLTLSDLAHAVHLPLRGTALGSSRQRLGKRASLFGTSTLNDTSNVAYYTNITLGGNEYTVQIDTGSSDLWVADTVSNSTSTGKNSSVTYASGSAQGPIHLAELVFAGYSIPNQAFLQVTPDDSNPQGSGLIGLGPSSSSNIFTALKSSNDSGDPPLDRIFNLNHSTPNFMTLLLGRNNDPSDSFPGDLTVGEILPGYEAITTTNQLQVTVLSSIFANEQHFQVLLDEHGFVLPNGTAISIPTITSNIHEVNQARVVFDSGFSLPQVPDNIAEGIYGNVNGAKLQNFSDVGPTWTLPCTEEVNITFIFGGQKIPIHPLDVSIPSEGIISEGSSSFCIGTFQPTSITDSFFEADDPTFDMILGMAFLRNVYSLNNFGDFVDGTSSTASPYMQFLSTTNDTHQAHLDFVKERLNGVDTVKEINALGTIANSSNAGQRKSELIRYIVVGGLLGILLLGAIIGCCCCCRKRIRARKPGGARARGGLFKGRYQPLDNPALPTNSMHMGPRGGHGHVQQQSYDNPFDSRY